MNIIYTSKIFSVFLFFSLLSCQSINLLDKDKNISTNVDNEINNFELTSTINTDKIIESEKFIDNYSNLINFNWKVNEDYEIIKSIKTKYNKFNDIKPINIFIINNEIYSIDYDSIFRKYVFDDKKPIFEKEIILDKNNDFSYVTSTAKINNYIYIAYSDGYLICIDLDANIIWQKYFEDIIKTPIKIHNNNILLLLSNNIISVNSLNGKVEWDFPYSEKKSISGLGGTIISKNNILFFTLPNGNIGQIDTLIREKISSKFTDLNISKGFIDYQYKLHNYKNVITFFENKKYLYSIDVKNNEIILNKFIIKNINSAYFYNNSLFILDSKRNLKVLNTYNGKIFWKNNLEKIISKNNKIVNISNHENNIIVFFANGKIINFDITTGEIIFENKIKLKNIVSIKFFNDYLFVFQKNGNISILK